MPDHERIPSLEVLGDRLEAAAARSMAVDPATSRRSIGRPVSPFRNRWVLAPALAAFVVLALVASVLFTNGRNGGDAAEAAVTSAARRSSETTTGRFQLAVDLDTGNGPRRVDVVGAYDTATGRVLETIDASALLGQLAPAGTAVPSGLQAQLLLDRGTIYAALPGGRSTPEGSARWFRLGAAPGDGTATAIEPLPADPSGVFALLGGVGNVENLGGEAIGGAIATHYRGVIDLDRAYRELSDADRRRVEQSLGSSGAALPPTGQVPVDVWVGSDGMVRRLAMDLPGGSGPSTGLSFSARITMDISGLGQPVDIPVPDPSTVTELPGLDALVPGSLSGGPGTTR